MWVSLLQKALVVIFSCKLVIQSQCSVIKRSPLELGYVTFPNEVVKHKHLPILNKIAEDEDTDKVGVVNSVTSGVTKASHTQEWVPGQIRHHSFIPGHVHHIYVPLLIARDLEAVLVKPPENIYFYPRHYGGYGVGTYAGGQGAGHGFQIIFNE